MSKNAASLVARSNPEIEACARANMYAATPDPAVWHDFCKYPIRAFGRAILIEVGIEMQRRAVVGMLAILAVALALMASGAMAATLGNAAVAREFTGDGYFWDYSFSDINPESALGAGQWTLGQSWHLYAGLAVDQNMLIDLLVWRKINDTQYQLIVRDPVVIAAGAAGIRDISVGAAAKSAVLQADDCLGFYVPYNGVALPAVVAFDQVSAAGDPYYAPGSGGESWAINNVVTLTSTPLVRQYSLNADVVPNSVPAPEPTTILALATGLVGLVLKRRTK